MERTSRAPPAPALQRARRELLEGHRRKVVARIAELSDDLTMIERKI